MKYQERILYVSCPEDVRDVDNLMKQGYRTEQSLPFCHGWLITLCSGQRPPDYSDDSDEWKQQQQQEEF